MSQAEIELARHAKSALSNPAIEQAFVRYREKVIDQLQAADPLDTDRIVAMKRHLNTISVVRKNLEIMVADGFEAEQKLEWERTTAAQRAKNALRRAVGV